MIFVEIKKTAFVKKLSYQNVVFYYIIHYVYTNFEPKSNNTYKWFLLTPAGVDNTLDDCESGRKST